MNVPINNQYMTPGFNEVIKRYMKKYNVSYREAASILGKRKKNTTNYIYENSFEFFMLRLYIKECRLYKIGVCCFSLKLPLA